MAAPDFPESLARKVVKALARIDDGASVESSFRPIVSGESADSAAGLLGEVRWTEQDVKELTRGGPSEEDIDNIRRELDGDRIEFAAGKEEANREPMILKSLAMVCASCEIIKRCLARFIFCGVCELERPSTLAEEAMSAVRDRIRKSVNNSGYEDRLALWPPGQADVNKEERGETLRLNVRVYVGQGKDIVDLSAKVMRADFLNLFRLLQFLEAEKGSRSDRNITTISANNCQRDKFDIMDRDSKSPNFISNSREHQLKIFGVCDKATTDAKERLILFDSDHLPGVDSLRDRAGNALGLVNRRLKEIQEWRILIEGERRHHSTD